MNAIAFCLNLFHDQLTASPMLNPGLGRVP